MSVTRPAAAILSLTLLVGAAGGAQTQTPPSAAYPFLLAGALLADGETEAALAAFSEAARIAPQDPFVHLEYASVLARAGRLVAAAGEARIARQFAPNDVDVIRTQARIAMNLAEHDEAARAEAMKAFEEVVAAEPDDLEGLVALGQLYLGAEQPAKAVTVLNRAAELRPGQPMIEALRARALVSAGDPQAAEAVQKSILAAHPDRLDVRLELAELLSSRDQHFEAAALLAAAPESQQKSPEVRRRRAVELYLDGDLKTAGDIARELHAELPDNSSVLVLLATIEQADGRWASVLELVGPAAERNPLQDQLNYLVVRSYERLGRIEEALVALARRGEALAGVGRTGEAALVEASAVLLAARNDRAEAALEMSKRVLRAGGALEPESALDLRLLQADLEFELHGLAPAIAGLGTGHEGAAAAEIGAKRYELAVRGDDAKAAAGYRRELAAGSLDDSLALAAAEERLEKFQAALPLIEKGLAVEPKSSELRFRKATALERTGRFEESAAIFEELIAAEPDHAPALNYLGYMRIERGAEVEKGLELVRRALQLDANNGAYVDSLGWGLYRLGRFAEASEVLERASRLLPDDSTVLEHLGDSLLALGALDRARDAYRRALAAGPDAGSGLAAKLANLPGAS